MICTRCADGTLLIYIKRKLYPKGFHRVCKISYRYTSGIRKGFFFEGSRFGVRTLILIMYKYLNRKHLQVIAYELNVDRGTVSDYTDFARDAITEFSLSNNDKIGGINQDGTSKIDEIDESLFFKRKYNRERFKMGNGM
ncbi:hypothetical protein DMUE_5110 [Dictyocoela muelleri]|nr:hypothetical protein DMUE_5110 [Dictyocoela muelleri]